MLVLSVKKEKEQQQHQALPGCRSGASRRSVVVVVSLGYQAGYQVNGKTNR
jgi:hypothetical protein